MTFRAARMGRGHVKHVIEAKKPETRARRIAATVATLLDGSGPAARKS